MIPFGDVPDILTPFLKVALTDDTAYSPPVHIVLKYCHGINDTGQGVIRAEATFLTPSGDNFGCVWIRVAVDH